MQPGVYSDIPNADYHSGPGISNSGLALVRKSPMHLRVRQVAANDNAPKKTSAAFAIGTAFHALLLEPEAFAREYCLALRPQDVPGVIEGRDQLVAMIGELNAKRLPKLPTTGSKAELVERLLQAMADMNPNDSSKAEDFAALSGAELKEHVTTLNKGREGLLSASGTIDQLATMLRAEGMTITLWSEVKAEWLANNGHRTVLEQEQFDQLHSMRAAVMAHPAASRLMSRAGKAEQSVYWIDAATGELCRCRPDFWTDDGIIVDVKTTEDASPEGFARSIANYGYDVQDAFYQDGVAAAGRPVRAFLFLAVQKDACVVDGHSYGVAVYQMDEASRELGRAKYRQDLGVYAQCRRTNIWPNYGDKIESISLPQWQFNKSAHLLESVG